jgi:hypothetical protein
VQDTYSRRAPIGAGTNVQELLALAKSNRQPDLRLSGNVRRGIWPANSSMMLGVKLTHHSKVWHLHKPHHRRPGIDAVRQSSTTYRDPHKHLP